MKKTTKIKRSLKSIIKKIVNSENLKQSALNTLGSYGAGFAVKKAIREIYHLKDSFNLLEHFCLGVPIGTYFSKKFGGWKGAGAGLGLTTLVNVIWEGYEIWSSSRGVLQADTDFERYVDVAFVYGGTLAGTLLEKLKQPYYSEKP
ncbi:hypothetical protein GF374_02800 [Candidatus Woesearchaeota archaeon]|nr:hypothetical protein [Candidatus Woesearchaeota archaeon]